MEQKKFAGDVSTGMVVYAVKGNPMRPVVWVLRDAKNNRPTKVGFAHLLYAADKFISKAKYPEDAGLNLDMEYEQLMKQLV